MNRGSDPQPPTQPLSGRTFRHIVGYWQCGLDWRLNWRAVLDGIAAGTVRYGGGYKE